ncbi:MAG TPA: glycosyltransferase [bacterium]|nr:glycosyltransferase [bacterium]
MLILHYLVDLLLSGPHRGTAEVCARLKERGFTCVAASLTGDGPGRAYFDERGVELHLVGGPGDSSLKLGLELARLAKRIGATALHGHPNRLPTWIAGLVTGRPAFVTFHRYGFDSPLERRLTKLTSPFMGGYACVSRRVRDYVLDVDRVHPSRVALVPNGLDTERFRPGIIEREDARRGLGLGPGETVLGYVGRLGHRKGLDHLLRAAARIPGSIVLLAGAGYHEEHLRDLARELGTGDRVRFLGTVPDPRPVYAACDLAVAVGRGESFNRGMAEPLALGVPAVGLAQGGCVEILPREARGLLIFEYSDRALGEKIAKLLDDPAGTRAMTDAASRHIRQNHSLEAMTEGYVELYTRVLLEGKRPADSSRPPRAPRLPGVEDSDRTPHAVDGEGYAGPHLDPGLGGKRLL